MRLILFLSEMWKNMEKQLFFRVAMAGLGKYHAGGYGRIGVYRVKHLPVPSTQMLPVLEIHIQAACTTWH